jgi:hypothetical protein
MSLPNSNERHKIKIMLSQSEQIQNKLKRLSPEDAFIFLFYYSGAHKSLPIPFKVGSVYHFNLLKVESAKDPCLAEITEALSTRLFPTFNSKALRMVNLANEVRSAGVSPAPYLPSSLRDKSPASLSKSILNKFASSNTLSPACPHVKASFEWYDHNHRPRPKKVRIKAHRFLFSSLVTSNDVKYSWLSEKRLEISIRYPDMMNYPVELVDLVTDSEGNQVFHASTVLKKI